MQQRYVVLINGLPGSGKTTLARPLAAALGVPLLCKDTVKETIGSALTMPEGTDPRGWSTALSRVAMDVLWSMLADAGAHAVVEANMLGNVHHHATAGLERAGFAPHETIEVWCDVPAGLARQRFESRAPRRHPVHGPQVGLDDLWPMWIDQARPLALGRVIVVDTTDPVDVPGLAARISAAARPVRPRVPAGNLVDVHHADL